MQDDSTTKDASSQKTSLTDWRLSQVFGGDKAPEEEIPEGSCPFSLHSISHDLYLSICI